MKESGFIRIIAMIFAICMVFGNSSTVYAEEIQMKETIGTEVVNQEEGITRLYGSNRYETSYAIASALKEQLGKERFDTVILANGNNFPDALAGSYLASVKEAPILMAREKYKNSLHEYIRNNLKPDGIIYVLGGTSAVPESVLSGLSGYNIKRLSGQDRYETNLLILKEASVTDENILVCTGKGFADSLSASATGKPILLLNNKKLTAQQKDFFEEHMGNKYYIIGGTSVISENMENEVAQYGTVERVSGLTRYETSIAVAEKFFAKPEEVVLTYAKNFPDGLCGGPLANKMNAPLVLTAEGKDDVAKEYVSENNIQLGKALGGDSVLPDRTVKNIFGYVGNISKESYKQAVNYLKQAESYLRQDELEEGVEYLEKVYAITQNKTILNFISRLKEGGYNTEGIELQLGRVKKIKCYDNSGKLFATYENSYDDIGRWIKMQGKYSDTSTSWYDEYQYDVNGNHIQTDSYTYDGGASTTVTHTSRHENIFDELGRCVRVNYYTDWYGEDALIYYLNYYGASGEYTGYDQWSYDMAYYYDTTRPRAQVSYQYDSEGRKTSEVEVGQDTGISNPDWRSCTTYFYDEDGKCIEKKLKYDDDRQPAEITAYTYDKEGRCIQEITTYESESYDKVVKYTYGNSLNYEAEEILHSGYRDYWEYIYDELELYIEFNSKHNFSGYNFIV